MIPSPFSSDDAVAIKPSIMQVQVEVTIDFITTLLKRCKLSTILMDSNSEFLENLYAITPHLIPFRKETLTSISSSALNHISSNVSGTLGSLGGDGGASSPSVSATQN